MCCQVAATALITIRDPNNQINLLGPLKPICILITSMLIKSSRIIVASYIHADKSLKMGVSIFLATDVCNGLD